ncbi:MAG: hypothetical protein XE08_0318 [Parcubacteria bacterium 32_520]|nr:MAG: hypothetical protein XE08_0318 [Parcubacteria bacterium 32_520]
MEQKFFHESAAWQILKHRINLYLVSFFLSIALVLPPTSLQFQSIRAYAQSFARAGKKEGGWGEGIFARPRFSAAAEFRANKVCTPQFYFPDSVFYIDSSLILPKFIIYSPSFFNSSSTISETLTMSFTSSRGLANPGECSVIITFIIKSLISSLS